MSSRAKKGTTGHVDPYVIEGTTPVIKSGKIRYMVTKTHRGSYAWTQCGRCKQEVAFCTCEQGIYHPRYIAWCVWVDNRPTTATHTLLTDYIHLYDPSRKQKRIKYRNAAKKINALRKR